VATALDVAALIVAGPWRRSVLEVVRQHRLPDWAVGAGFVRSAVWDALHGHHEPTPLADVDVLYFDRSNHSREREVEIEEDLTTAMVNVPWSVRNQARMHLRNGDRPYADTTDALRYWFETRPTPRGREKLAEYRQRIGEKNWRAYWPQVRILDA
jgi:hypothetical protein